MLKKLRSSKLQVLLYFKSFETKMEFFLEMDVAAKEMINICFPPTSVCLS